MRYLIASMVTAVLFFSSSTQAKDFDYNDFCLDMAGLAETTMTMRQYGKPITELMKENRESTKGNDWLNDILVIYTKEAYAVPLRLSEAVKEMEISEFTNKKYLDCLAVYE